MAALPAVVTITDLPTGTTLTGAELFEAVQTSGGVANSIQVAASQLFATLGGLPTSSVTGTLLQSLGTGYSATWITPASFVTVGTGLAIAGSTSLTLSRASTAGLSVLGVAGTATAVPLAIAGTANQVLAVNSAGTALGFGLLAGANIATAAIGTTQLQTAAGLSVLAVNSSGAANFSVVSGAAGQVLAVNPAGTGIAFQGGAVLLNTLTPNGVTLASDTQSITTTFNNYLITLSNVVPTATTNPGLQMQIATSGSAFQSTNYIAKTSGDVSSENSTAAIILTGLTATTGVGNATTYGVGGHFYIYGAPGSASRKMVTGQMTWLNGTTSTTSALHLTQLWGYWDGANSPITGLQFGFQSGNIATGIIKIYGIA